MIHPSTARRSLLAAAVAAMLVLAACSSGSKAASLSPTTKVSPSSTASTTAVPKADPTRPTPPADDYGVGSRTLHLVDTTRPTAASVSRKLAAKPTRSIDVLVLYPTAGPTGTNDVVPDAAVADGRFPIVEFSHGVTASGPAYARFLAPIARAGYVILAPTFPLTSNSAQAWNDLGDYKNQPADVSFVLDQALALDTKAGDPFEGHLASGEIAVAGHSLGAITTFGFFDSCCTDPRVKAAVELSGVELPFTGGTFDDPPDVPLLLIHGQKDGTVPYKGSKNAFDSLPGPRALLTFPGGSHIDPVYSTTDAPVSQDAIRAFLALELRDDPTEWDALPATYPVGNIVVAGDLVAPGSKPG